MIAANTLTHTMSNSNLVITKADYDRLNDLLQSPHYRTTHAALLVNLKQELEQSKVVEPFDVPKGVVTMRSQVRVRDLDERESETFTLVYPQEADINQGKLSVLAPLGTALLGVCTGQTIAVQVPAGIRRLKVEQVLYQPEAAGDLHL